MRFAPIGPATFKEELLKASTDYHFALGQELIRDREYFELYREIGQRGGTFLIVDNGAAEFDQPPFEAIVEKCNAVGASEIIMPDVLFDADATIKATCSMEARKLVPPSKRMIVPQGRNIQEWAVCLHTIHEQLSGWYRSIGIPKHVESMYGGRPVAVKHLVDLGFTGKNIHLLGAYRNLVLETQRCAAVYPGIRGADSGEPVAHAQCGIMSNPTAPHVSLQWKTEVLPHTGALAARNIERAITLLGQQGGSHV